ncbi:hypothetical protein ABID77_004343 [Variovorax sp. PvP013]
MSTGTDGAHLPHHATGDASMSTSTAPRRAKEFP